MAQYTRPSKRSLSPAVHPYHTGDGITLYCTLLCPAINLFLNTITIPIQHVDPSLMLLCIAIQMLE